MEGKEQSSKAMRDLKKLLDEKQKIDALLFNNFNVFEMLHKNEVICPSLDDLIEFSENITPTSHAPHLWRPGFPLQGSHPPAPQFEEMRMGYLQKYNDRMKGLNSLS